MLIELGTTGDRGSESGSGLDTKPVKSAESGDSGDTGDSCDSGDKNDSGDNGGCGSDVVSRYGGV